MTTWHLFLKVDLSTKGQKRRVSWAMCLLIFFVTQKVFYALTSSFLACSRCSDGRQIKNIASRERSKKRMGKEAREHLHYSGTPSDRSILTLSVNTQAPLMQLSNAIWRCQTTFWSCFEQHAKRFPTGHFSNMQTKIMLRKMLSPNRSRIHCLLVTSPDALPLSYRRLVGA